MNVRIFTSEAIRQQLTTDEINALISDFRAYKNTGFPPDTFGRDAPYDDYRTWPRVKQEEVFHIHLADGETSWPANILQYRRTSNRNHLVYCKGATHQNVYLLIIILRPDAHSMHRNPIHMERIGQIALNFRNSY